MFRLLLAVLTAIFCSLGINKNVLAEADSASMWTIPGGSPVPDTESTKTKDGFGGTILITPDKDVSKKWSEPNPPHFNAIGKSIDKGKQVSIVIFLSNPKLDKSKRANVSCSVTIIDPKGKASHDIPEGDCFSSGPIQNPKQVFLATKGIGFVGDPSDPSGRWTVKVVLTDLVRKTKIALEQSFILK